MASSTPTIGLGVLSWHGYDSLAATLKSYRAQNFPGLFQQSLVFLPDMTDRGVGIAHEFGFEHAGSAHNLGILGGFKAMAQALSTDYILLCENDFNLTEDLANAHAQLERAMAYLTTHQVHVVRLRSRTRPGLPWPIDKPQRYWPPGPDTLVTRLRRLVRPGKAQRLLGTTVYYRDDGPDRFPNLIRRTTNSDFLVRGDILPWSNNPFLINRRFFLDTVIPAAEGAISGRLINGFPTIETELNRGWWRAQKYWVAVMNPGLFTHARHNDRGY